MANIVVVLGPSGTGKSTSIKGLDPKTTVVFNTLKKRLPFKGSMGLYNKENKNLFEVTDYTQVISMLKSIDKNASYVKNVVIDDCIFIMRKEYFNRANESGYKKYTDLAVHMQNIIKECEDMRADLNIFLMLHSEPVVSDGTITTYKIATVGKLLDNQYNIAEVVPMILYSSITFVDKKPQYGFYTHAVMDRNGTVVLAKTPEGMFDKDYIPNDLGLVVKAMNEYYG